MTHAGVIPCVKTNDISRILSKNWYLENVIKKMKDERKGEEEWSVVVTGGRNGRRHGDGRRRQAAAATMHARLFERLIPFLIAEQ